MNAHAWAKFIKSSSSKNAFKLAPIRIKDSSLSTIYTFETKLSSLTRQDFKVHRFKSPKSDPSISNQIRFEQRIPT